MGMAVKEVLNFVWDVGTMSWVKETQAGGGGATGDVNIASDSVGLARQAQLPASLGQKAMAQSLSVAIASDQSAVPVSDGGGSLTVDGTVAVTDGGGSITVDGTFFQATQPISAVALPLPAGAATAALQTQPGVDIGDVTINNAGGGSAVNIQDGGNSITVDGTITANIAAAQTLATLTNLVQMNGAAIAMGTGTRSAGTQRVTIATDDLVPISDGGGSITVDGALTATISQPSASAVTSVAGNTSSVTLKASNASRKGLAIFNDSTSILYVKLGTTASATDYTVKILGQGYFELPSPAYTGRVDGIWVSATGFAYITEMT